MRHLLLLGYALLIAACSATAQTSEDPKVETIPVRGNIYMLKGQGGNLGVLTGEDGVFVVDAQYARMGEKLRAAITALNDEPIHYLVNTHWHGDHTGGNEGFAEVGARLIAHRNVYDRMSQPYERRGETQPAAPEAARPDITFTDELEFRINGQLVMVFHVDNAHTDGDAVVYFPESNVIHAGDVLFYPLFPYIDRSSGGSLDGVLRAVNRILFLANDDTKIIPGHGNLTDRAGLIEYRDMLLDLRNKVGAQIRAGKTKEEIVAMNLHAPYQEKWNWNFISGERMIEQVYDNLTAE